MPALDANVMDSSEDERRRFLVGILCGGPTLKAAPDTRTRRSKNGNTKVSVLYSSRLRPRFNVNSWTKKTKSEARRGGGGERPGEGGETSTLNLPPRRTAPMAEYKNK